MVNYAVLDTCYVAHNDNPRQRIGRIRDEGYRLIIPSLVLDELPGKVSPDLFGYLSQIGQVDEHLPGEEQTRFIRRKTLRINKSSTPSLADCQIVQICLNKAGIRETDDVLVLTSDLDVIGALVGMYIHDKRLDKVSVEIHKERRCSVKELYQLYYNKD